MELQMQVDLPLPPSLTVEPQSNGIWVVTLNRPEKRNALDDATIAGLEHLFANLPDTVRAVVLKGTGEHFCAGLDLTELGTQPTWSRIGRSQSWHRAFERIEFARVPVVAALQGAVIGGGLELACAAHIRVADASVFYGLPEGQRGIYLGGGGSVRLPKLVGVANMMDMMLTGRVHNAQSGQSIGMSQYTVAAGQSLTKALELATAASNNAALVNFAVLHTLPRIYSSGDPQTGYLLEALMSVIAQGEPEAQSRLQQFLAHKVGKITKPA
jgi:enoyl-CoA hydratase/carnithine racemase